MASEEIKIRVTTSADNGALKQTEQDLTKVGQAAASTGKKLNGGGTRVTKVPESTAPEGFVPKIIDTNIPVPKRAATGSQAPSGSSRGKSSMAAENASAAAFMRQEEEREALAKESAASAEIEKKAAAEAATAEKERAKEVKARAAIAKGAAKQDEKDAKEEKQNPGLRGGRLGGALRVAGMDSGTAAMAGVGGMLVQQIAGAIASSIERLNTTQVQSENLRADNRTSNRHFSRQAQGATDAGSHTGMIEAGEDAHDQYAKEIRNRSNEIKNSRVGRKVGSLTAGLSGAGAGAMSGGAIGGPYGAIIGAAVGAVSAVGFNLYTSSREIDLKKKDIEETKKQKEGREKNVAALKTQRKTEIDLEMDQARAESKHTADGMKRSRLDKEKLTWAAEYGARIKEFGIKGEGKAAEMADLKVKEDLRRMQLNAAGGMVDARSGAGDIAQAARVATMNIPGMEDLKRETVAMHSTYKSAAEAQSRFNHSPDPLPR